MFADISSADNEWSQTIRPIVVYREIILEFVVRPCPIAHCCSQNFATAMVLKFVSPARRTSLALVAGLLLFAVLAAATVDNRDKISVGDLSVPEIEDKLQVIAP